MPNQTPKSGYNNNGYRQMYAATAIICVITILVIVLLAFLFGKTNPIDISAESSVNSENVLPPAISEESFYVVSQDAGNKDYVNYVEISKSNDGIRSGPLVYVGIDGNNPPNNTAIQTIDIYERMIRGVYGLSTTGLMLDDNAVTAFNGMLQGFYDATGGNGKMVISDAFISVADLVKKDKLDTYADLASYEAVRLSIKNADGESMGEGEYLWLNDNCYRFGIVLRYPDGKEAATGVSGSVTLYRYVGLAHAVYMKNNNLCLEEYLDEVAKHDYKDPIRITYGDAVYKVYYYKSSEAGSTLIYVPSDHPYEISGNNRDGFIITVTERAIAETSEGSAS